MKVRINKLDFVSIKHFCSVKDTIKRIKRQTTDWEKIFAKDIYKKGLLCKIYKDFLRHKKKINNPI